MEANKFSQPEVLSLEALIGNNFRTGALIVIITTGNIISIGKFQVSRQDNFKGRTLSHFTLHGYLALMLLNNLKAN